MRSGLGVILVMAAVATFWAASCGPGWWAYDADFLESGRTLSHFTAIQVDPQSEDSAGPQFVIAADLNGDDLQDLVSAWNQSQPVQVHLQRRSDEGLISFETITLAGNVPVVQVAGLVVSDFDRDEHPDIAVLVKESNLTGPTCITGSPEVDDATVPVAGTPLTQTIAGMYTGVILVYFGPDDPAECDQALAWEEVPIGVSQLAGGLTRNSTEDDVIPEEGGFTSMKAGDINLDGNMDLVVAWNSACPDDGDTVLIFRNLGRTAARDGTWRVESLFDPYADGEVKDVGLADVDLDGDLDIVATRPLAQSMNVRWFRNPARDVPDDYHLSDSEWHTGTIGQVDTVADVLSLGDLDGDGATDVVVRSTDGMIVQWFRGAANPTSEPVRQIPWQVYTLAEFTERTPESIALGDLNNDGQLELVIGAQGGLAWFDPAGAPSVYDQWIERLIIDDIPASETDDVPATTDPNVEPAEIPGETSMNGVVVADIDGDGVNDIVTTLDRAGLSGLSNDAVVWFRNTNRP